MALLAWAGAFTRNARFRPYGSGFWEGATKISLQLNHIALRRCQQLVENADLARVNLLTDESGARIVDAGIDTTGGLTAGVALAEVCLAGLGEVAISPAVALGSGDRIWSGPVVSVRTDQPIAACMASQYAGWQLAAGKYFAMGSGPMRAAGSNEKLFDAIGFRERPDEVVGVLETGKLPPSEVCQLIAAACGVEAERLTLIVAPTASIAGCIQIVARTVETALHKLHELHFDINRVVCGHGAAPLPPVAADDLAGIGRTNDAVLYGGEVTLWVTGDDASLDEIGPRIPSSASRDYGRPFAEIFAGYNHDFYQIDPLLFSPAAITLTNVDTGRSRRFGAVDAELICESFLGKTV